MGSHKLKQQEWVLKSLHQILCVYAMAVSLGFLWDLLTVGVGECLSL